MAHGPLDPNALELRLRSQHPESVARFVESHGFATALTHMSERTLGKRLSAVAWCSMASTPARLHFRH
jgi:hypothetical protein